MNVHIGRVHSFKCDDCGMKFGRNENLKRHKEVKTTLANIDPKSKGNLTIKTLKTDEICLAIFNTNLMESKPILILHSWDCWSRSGHCCPDRPATSKGINNNIGDKTNSTILHTLISDLVLGDYSMSGCYVQWARIEEIAAGNAKPC